MRRTVLATLTIAVWAGPSAHTDSSRPADLRPRLYDPAGDSAAPSILETLTSVKDWWRSSLGENLTGHQQHLSFHRLPSGKVSVVDEESWSPCLAGAKKLPDPRSRTEDLSIWGSVLLLHGEYATIRAHRAPKAPAGDFTWSSLYLGFGIPLSRNRVYFISGKPSAPEELLLEFEVDPFLNERGMVKVRRVSGPRWTTYQATFRTTHRDAIATTPAEVAFEGPSGPLPKMTLSGPLAKDCFPTFEGRSVVSFDSQKELHRGEWHW